MKYRIELQPTAIAELESAYLWLRERSPQGAIQWRIGLMSAIATLTALPERCAEAPESAHFERPIRQLLYGKRGGVYRVLYTVDEAVVHILHIRHSAQQFLDLPDDARSHR